MNSDRNEGLLVFNLKGSYKVSVEGAFEDRNGIICHEFNNKASCNAAFDMEQLLLTAFSSIQRKSEEAKTKKQIQKEEKEENDFYENDSPSPSDIKERADQLCLMFKMQKEVRMSELMDLFEEFVAEKLISTEGDKVMYGQTWDKLNNGDRLDIMFRYIVFFVNPLQSLSQMAMTESEGSLK